MAIISRSTSLTPACQIALAALEAGLSVLPIRPDGSKQPAVLRWKTYQQIFPTREEVQNWFQYPYCGLALVTGQVSGGLIALDFDDVGTFEKWIKLVQDDSALNALYEFIAAGYEEKTPKGGRHLLFRCPEAFCGERRPGSQKLALRPMPPPQRFETLAETREEASLIIIDPSRGLVHSTGRPYTRLRGSVTMIRTIGAEERNRLYASVQTLNEVPDSPQPDPLRVFRSQLGAFRPRVSESDERPGDLFMSAPANSWESLLIGWDMSKPELNPVGHPERYLRHPGKVGAKSSATLNADGTDRLFCFSPSVGLPTNCYLNKFEFYAYWCWGGDFKAAARDLAAKGYSTKRRLMSE